MEKNAPLLGHQISENTPPRKKKRSSSSSVVWTVIKGVRDKTLLGPLVCRATEGGGNGTDIHTFTKAWYRSMGTTGDPVPVGHRDGPDHHFTG
jgi:glucose dehydrogenase